MTITERIDSWKALSKVEHKTMQMMLSLLYDADFRASHKPEASTYFEAHLDVLESLKQRNLLDANPITHKVCAYSDEDVEAHALHFFRVKKRLFPTKNHMKKSTVSIESLKAQAQALLEQAAKLEAVQNKFQPTLDIVLDTIKKNGFDPIEFRALWIKSEKKTKTTTGERKKRFTITPEIKEKVIEALKAGKTVAEVSKEFGPSTSAVNAIKSEAQLTKKK